MQREVKKELKTQSSFPKISFAQDILRQELEKDKKERKSLGKAQKETQSEEKFIKKQAKKKKKIRGH